MDKSSQAWDDVTSQLVSLGMMFKDRYREYEEKPGSSSPSEEEVKDAFNTLGETVTAAFAVVGDAVKDPQVHEETRLTAGLFLEALGTTFSELGDELSLQSDQTDRLDDPAAENDPPPPETVAVPEDESESAANDAEALEP